MTQKRKHIFAKMAQERGLIISDAKLSAGIDCFVSFLRAALVLENDVKQKMRDFGPDQFRETRQRIIAASAGITPERLCEPPANDNYSRTCANRIQHSGRPSPIC